MTAKTLIAAVATVAFTIAATAMTVTTAVAAEPTSATATQTAGAVLSVAKTAQASTGLTREQVIAETIEARKKGLIPETEADFDVAQTKKPASK